MAVSPTIQIIHVVYSSEWVFVVPRGDPPHTQQHVACDKLTVIFNTHVRPKQLKAALFINVVLIVTTSSN